MSVSALKFKHPFTCIVAGTTGSGKTRWTRSLLRGWKYIIDFKKNIKTTLKVIWFHGQKQSIHNHSIKNVEIYYHKGLPKIELIKQVKPDIIIIDDLMGNIDKNVNVRDLFIKGSHHRNISVIFIVQNIFNRDKHMRTISLNTHYFNFMRGDRLTQQVGILANQIFPGKGAKVIEVFNRATDRGLRLFAF